MITDHGRMGLSLTAGEPHRLSMITNLCEIMAARLSLHYGSACWEYHHTAWDYLISSAVFHEASSYSSPNHLRLVYEKPRGTAIRVETNGVCHLGEHTKLQSRKLRTLVSTRGVRVGGPPVGRVDVVLAIPRYGQVFIYRIVPC